MPSGVVFVGQPGTGVLVLPSSRIIVPLVSLPPPPPPELDEDEPVERLLNLMSNKEACAVMEAIPAYTSGGGM